MITPIWQKSDTGLTERFRETQYSEALARFEQYAAKEGANGLPAAVSWKYRMARSDNVETQGPLRRRSESPDKLGDPATDADADAR